MACVLLVAPAAVAFQRPPVSKPLPLHSLHTDDWVNESVNRRQPLLARWIAMSSGHPRTIAVVQLAFANVTLFDIRSALDLMSKIANLAYVSAFASAWQYIVPAFTGVLFPVRSRCLAVVLSLCCDYARICTFSEGPL